MEKNFKIKALSASLAVLLLSNGYALKIAKADTKYKRGTIIEEVLGDEDYQYLGYVAKQGDNLSEISRKISAYYGLVATPIFWPVLADMNGGSTLVRPGDVFKFPCTLEEMQQKYLEVTGKEAKVVIKDTTRHSKKQSENTTENDIVDIPINGPMTVTDYVRKSYGMANHEFVEVYLKYLGLYGKYTDDTIITDKDNLAVPTPEQLLDYLTEESKNRSNGK